MRLKALAVVVLCSAAFCLAPAFAQQAPFAAAPGEPACPGKGGLVKARVVAVDQPISFNRLGASLPNGMIFALEHDVCTPGRTLPDGLTACGPGKPSQGNAVLRPGKRPRPLVLRVNQDQCLEITFTNWLSPTAVSSPAPPPGAGSQPATRAASVHVQGMEWVQDSEDDGSWVGNNPSSLVRPGETKVYTLFAPHEGTFLLYSTADNYGGNAAADGGQLAFGLFGAVHVEPRGAEWYRSQVTREDLELATRGHTPTRQPILDYRAVYPKSHSRAGFPILNMLNCPNQAQEGCPWGGEIVHSDLTAVITGREKDGKPGRFPAKDLRAPVFNPAYALPDRLEPYREFTIIYHEIMQAVQAFDQMYGGASLNFDGNGADNFAINYGAGGIGSEIVANRLGVGPMGNCPSCKYEEFFLTSWAVGDPAMVVDVPATDACEPVGTCGQDGPTCNPDVVTATCGDGRACQFSGYTCDTRVKATRAFYSDDPSNVYHSYIADHTKFRVLHAGPDLHHLHHQHAHQWLHSPDTPTGDYTDSQSLGPGSGFTLEMVYNGSGNVNQTVGDSIFHCHFYPHFAGGMWSLWRVHDVFEAGTEMKHGRPVAGSRALPDGEITAGTPIPAVVPMPTLAMAPMPGNVRLTAEGTQAEICDEGGGGCTSVFANAKLDPGKYKNPGFPFFIPGLGGQRAPHPPLDFAKEGSATLDGGLPRHLIKACASGGTCTESPPLNAIDFSKTLEQVAAFELPEDGTAVEQLAMATNAQRFHPSHTPEGTKKDFILNGLPPVAGAPYADPCIDFSREGGVPKGLTFRRYKAAAFQADVTFNKEGWHFPQQRMLSLWGDVADTLAGRRPPEPFFFRSNSGECIEYTHANLVPNVYELDDFEVRTPTDILGQHIHLVKFDVTSSDGATNGFNYEDGTFSPDEVSERIRAINAGGGLAPDPNARGGRPLTAKTIPFFGPGPGGAWVGAQATIQRWYADPLFDGCCHDPVQPGAKDRTLRTVFTHDHFGPSTHQQAGLYAGLVIEPPKSLWYPNEKAAGPPFGGTDPLTGKPLPGREATGWDGAKVRDGGPTTWQAVIETPTLPGQSTPKDSFREFLLEMQDSTLTYSPFPAGTVNKFAGQGYCSDNVNRTCTPATATQPATGCSSGAVCFGLGFCSNNPQVSCQPATWQADEDTSQCGYPQATCNLVAGVPGQVAAYAPGRVFLPNGKALVDANVYAWGTLPIDPPYKIGAEVITLAGATNSFSLNYRSEPLYPRINSQKGTTDAKLNDLSYAYLSLDRGALGGLCSGTSQFCTQTSQCSSGTCQLITKDPYPPLTRDVGPGDPYTPLLRAYAGDDVQIRTLTGAHINPHNFTLHGVKWLAEGSFVDSGWRASQTMGISEHFEQLLRLPAWVSGKGAADYLYMGGAAAIEQAGGNWGLLRAYGKRRDDLRALPQNQNPERGARAPVCPTNLKRDQKRSYTVVSTTAQQALGGPLVMNSRGSGISNPAAILYFKLQDLDCTTPSSSCKAKNPQNPQPLVLRANAGDCLEVTLYNVIDASVLSGTAGASSLTLLPSPLANPPSIANFAVDCGAPGAQPCLPSSISLEVGLHPQLVSFDVTAGNAFNAGNNSPQTVANVPGGNYRTYTWYAGNVDTSVQPPRYIPIEFGAANLLPSDVINHYQLGLFGALVIEPQGATGWTEDDGTTAVIRNAKGVFHFREFVLAMEDGLQNPPTPLAIGGDALNAFNLKTEPLSSRTCLAGDVACVLSSKTACCGTISKGICSLPCGDPQTPILEACAGEQVRLRLLHPGGINTNNSFELFGHVWAETPYMSRGILGCTPATTHTNLYSSSVISNQRGCTLANLGGGGPLPIYGPNPDTLSEWQGSRLGHGPGNHFDILLEKAGGANAVPGDYLYRSYPSMHFRFGPWGIFRVQDSTSNPSLCAPKTGAPGGSTTAAGGAGR